MEPIINNLTSYTSDIIIYLNKSFGYHTLFTESDLHKAEHSNLF